MATAERREFLIKQAERIAPLAGVDTVNKWIERLKAGNCPLCGVKPDESAFRDDLSCEEFALSHLCMKCQDETFAEPED